MKLSVILNDELLDKVQLHLKQQTLSEFINHLLSEYLETHKADSNLLEFDSSKEQVKKKSEVW